MAVETAAGLLYDRILRERAASVRSLVDSREQETDWLEFKGGEHLDEAQIRCNWSRALAGFANNEGGVLVWGIDARHDPSTRVDAASAVSLVSQPDSLRSRLSQLRPVATDPPIPGVLTETLFDNGVDGPGFVACFVPESQTKPHRADLMPGKPYMMRVAGSFIIPSVAMLRSLFFPRSSAQLAIEVMPKWEPFKGTPNETSTIMLRLHVTLRNDGIASAKDVFAIVASDPPAQEIRLPNGAIKRGSDSGSGIEYQRMIHPTSRQPLCFFEYEVPLGMRHSEGSFEDVPLFCPVRLTFKVFALDTPPAFIEVRFAEHEIEARFAAEGRPADAE